MEVLATCPNATVTILSDGQMMDSPSLGRGLVAPESRKVVLISWEACLCSSQR